MASSALSSGFLSLTLTISASTRMLSPPFTFLYKTKHLNLQTLCRFFSNFQEGHEYGLLICIDTKAECRHLKILTCIDTFRQEFIDWRYIQPCWYFRLSFVNCCPSNLHSGSTLPPPFPVWILYTRIHTVCKGGGGYVVLGLSPFTGQVFRWRHFSLPSMSLIFLRSRI